MFYGLYYSNTSSSNFTISSKSSSSISVSSSASPVSTGSILSGSVGTSSTSLSSATNQILCESITCSWSLSDHWSTSISGVVSHPPIQDRSNQASHASTISHTILLILLVFLLHAQWHHHIHPQDDIFLWSVELLQQFHGVQLQSAPHEHHSELQSHFFVVSFHIWLDYRLNISSITNYLIFAR